jgi:hypothetical protein
MVATMALGCAQPAGSESVGGVVGKRARLGSRASRASEGHTDSIFFECSPAAPFALVCPPAASGPGFPGGVLPADKGLSPEHSPHLPNLFPASGAPWPCKQLILAGNCPAELSLFVSSSSVHSVVSCSRFQVSTPDKTEGVLGAPIFSGFYIFTSSNISFCTHTSP